MKMQLFVKNIISVKTIISFKTIIVGGLSLLLVGCGSTAIDASVKEGVKNHAVQQAQQGDNLSPVASYLAASFSRDDLQIRRSINYYNTIGMDNLSPSVSADVMQYQLILGMSDDATASARRIYNDTTARLIDRVDASMVLSASAIGQGDYSRAVEVLNLTPRGELSKIGYAFMKAWSYVGMDDYPSAHATLSPLHNSPDIQVLARIHSSYIYARRGDYEQAYAVIAKIQRAPESIMRHKLQLLGLLGRWADAGRILTQFKGQGLPLPQDLVASVKNKSPVPFKSLSPMGRVGQSLLELSQSLGTFNAYLGLVYAQKARLAGMDNLDDAWFDTYIARMLGNMGAVDDAIVQLKQKKAQIPADEKSNSHVSIKVLLVDLYRKIDDHDSAIAVLDSLRDMYDCEPTIWELYGDIYNKQKRYRDAQNAYTQALACVENSENDKGAWVLYFKLGDAFASEKKWDETESNLAIAHRLSPNNALILNYLGYMWIEQGKNTDEALNMIKKSLTLDPDNGATVDSLGWAYYQLGRYDDAIVQLEKATDMEKNEPVVIDHLGDAYWRAGRKREAVYQWQRVLDLHENNPRVQDEVKAIRKKLVHGLPPIPSQSVEKKSP